MKDTTRSTRMQFEQKSRRKSRPTNSNRNPGDRFPTFQGLLFVIVPVSLRLIFRPDSTASYFSDSLVATGNKSKLQKSDLL